MKAITKRFNTWVLLPILATVALAGCGPSVQVRSDVAPDVDLAGYQTYGFFKQLGIEGDNYSNIFGQHFRAARALHGVADALDEFVPRVDVDAGVLVGQLFVAHRPMCPGRWP